MEKEHYQASKSMQKFFENLLEIKGFVKKKSEETKDEVLKEVYGKLDKVIKNSQEEGK